MKIFTKGNWRVVRFILITAILVSIPFQFYYGFNPLIELINLPRSYIISKTIMKRAAPEIRGIEAWLNTQNNQPVTIKSLRGKVVLVDFWTYSCINCKHDAPYVNDWYRKYHDQGLEVIGVHTPEFKFEEKLENVRQAVAEYGIEFPVALDNSYKTWRAYGNLYWPAKYLVDAQGNIVYKHYGEGEYDVTEAKIQELLTQIQLAQE